MYDMLLSLVKEELKVIKNLVKRLTAKNQVNLYV